MLNLGFNDEELFFMNRIAYRLFRLYACKMQFKEFIHDLETLQSATLNAALDLWLRLALETEENVASKKTN